MNKALFIIIFLLFFGACVEEVPYESGQIEPKLVLNGGITVDSIITIQLMLSQSVTDTGLTYVKDAQVKLYVDGSFIEYMLYDTLGYYRSRMKGETGKRYKIEASCAYAPKITAETTIPDKIIIDTAYMWKYESGAFFDGTPASEIKIKVKDPSEVENFYYVERFLLNDTFTLYTKPIDPAVLSGKNNKICYIFNDKLFNNSTYCFDFLVSRIENRDSFFYYIELQSISESYFKFLSSFFDYEEVLFGSLYFSAWNQVPEVYSNVQNGFGVFYGFNKSNYKLYYKK